MANDSGSNSGLAFIVGGLVVLVLVIAAVMYFGSGNLLGGSQKSVDVNINAPSVPAADK